MSEILFLILSYLLGSIPFGFIIYYLFEKKDIREKGSGNIGAANVWRTRGKAAGLITLVLDMLKGMIPILVGSRYFDYPIIVMLGGAAVILGHIFPVFLKFRGGKGVATFAGVLLAFSIPVFFIFICLFVLTVLITRYVSAGSLIGVTGAFFFILFTQVMEISMILLGIAVFIIIRHQSNLKKIFKGTENKLKMTKNE